MAKINNAYYKSKKLISHRTGLLHHIVKLPRLNYDPRLISFGIWSCDTLQLDGEKFGGRSSGCSYDLYNSFMGTLGETVERYCPAFYQKDKMMKSSYISLSENAVTPSEFALFHPKQHEYFKEKNFNMHPFDEKIELYWDKCVDITTGNDVYCPAAFIYLPWTIEEKWITVGTSTGLAAHTNWHKALLTALFEIIERDSFVITWYQKIVSSKIIIGQDIREYIDGRFPASYEWHFFDITYDLGIPTVFGICYGTSEYGDFVAVGTATRGTMADALKKVILEIGQGVGYFRYLLGEKKDWVPSDNFNEILNFEDHSIFYIKRPDLISVLDIWRKAKPSLNIDFNEKSTKSTADYIEDIITVLNKKNYNVLVKDITTPDVNQAGFYCLRVVTPQLLQMGGAYPFYFLGGKRLYEVPEKMGYTSHSYSELNEFPHPFP